ncbi:MAG TPA: metal-dependent transcriptional regulator [Ktedonobacterales bacterium]|jgi:DtxR family Mn-dependent transcriptional regulator
MTKSELRHKLAPSEAVEDYLKTIYLLREEALARGESGRVTTNALAERLDVEPGSVTGMLKKLAGEKDDAPKLVRHTPYHGVELTEVGEKLALEIVRHHRLLELYLTRVLGFKWDEVHEQADEMEHVISEEFEEKIDHMLGEPVTDPHGDPIPTRSGKLPEQPGLVALADLEPGRSARICRVRDQTPELLRHLETLHLLPETVVTVLERAPFGGPLRLRIVEPAGEPAGVANGESGLGIDRAEREQSIGPQLAASILVKRLAE